MIDVLTYMFPVLGYLAGSLASAIIVCRVMGLPDPRSGGSGNPGATNVLRLGGKKAALLTLLGDVFKGVIPVLIAHALELPALSIALTCLGSFLGHLYPIFFRFQGGKGAATMIGTLTVLNIALLVPLLSVWVLVLIITGYVGLASMLAAVSLPVWLALTRLPQDQPLFIYCCGMALFIIYCHRSNLQRMREGTETQNTKLMLFKRRAADSNDDIS